jgi:Spy/CpxP family protein refolding chaperone
MKKMTIVLALVLAVVFTATAYANPHQRGCGRHGDGGIGMGFGFFRILNRLDLDENQKRQVASVLKSHRDEIGNVATGFAEAKEALMNAGAADEFSEDAVKQAARATAGQVEQLIVLRARMMNEIKRVLTPEQTSMLRGFKDKRAARMQDHIEFRLDALDKWIADHS